LVPRVRFTERYFLVAVAHILSWFFLLCFDVSVKGLKKTVPSVFPVIRGIHAQIFIQNFARTSLRLRNLGIAKGFYVHTEFGAHLYAQFGSFDVCLRNATSC
jgi:hypothetical protein